ncbi:ATP-dependent DNA helicase [Peptoniphilus sp. MSJ-1]|uniref:ATP-dependent DNA helicase n=1 Tax=Peptoniphilus ovalis TaxID=2841503 RepID=A0ABS6FFB9_9FIRM|nr:ATP-dependent DNA helicase [Peptoniphilus ovalis]MBU5668855.1 ATP-dependent DNA helicase [Peptoniphilus ovalis]
MKEIKISVRNLIEFIKRSGDIDRRFFSNKRAVEGIRAHQKVQSLYSENYKSEVFLRTSEEIEDITFVVEGRADGIEVADVVTIDEIKSTTRDLKELEKEENLMHWAQAKCYGYIYAKNEELDSLDVMLTYYQLESEEILKIRKSFTFGELRDFFMGTLFEYLEFSRRIVEWREIRTESIKKMKFPFKNFRKGQRELAVSVYNTISDGNKLFVEAPTGIGKSMSTIFPTIKAIGEDKLDKSFYLVARSTGKEAAKNALEKLLNKNLKLKITVVTAKDKICINDEVKCNPKDCPYARGHFDRVNDAIIDIFDNVDNFSRKNIEKFAKLHMVCPFEYQLDLLDFSDFIVCDYNYIFDPSVYLKRFFENSMLRFSLLIDEAHNLVDRGRDMYSASLTLDDLVLLSEIVPKNRKSATKHINLAIEEYKNLGNGIFYSYEEFYKLNAEIEKTVFSMNDFLIKDKEIEHYDEALDIYFKLYKYIKILEYYNRDFVSIKLEDEVKIISLDISEIFREILKTPVASVFFSATLTPIKYYGKLLGAGERTNYYKIDSPFDSENLLVLRNTKISTVYRDRRDSIYEIVKNLEIFSKEEGNYLFFFPSYSFMEEVYEMYSKIDNAIIQKRDMNEIEREEFLENFTFSSNTTAFAVMGGVFSEGIDLIGDRLNGAAIITVGIPGISYERNILKSHFDKKYRRGYEYSYIYPGMIKAVQSAGRVIRTEEDRGRVLLIDLRFSMEPYKSLMPKAWNIEDFKEINEMEEIILNFTKKSL